jgi:hypothetical protein
MIMAILTKLNVARHQLGTALDLFIRDQDPIAVQCLACGGGELIEAIAAANDLRPFSTHMLESIPNLDIKKIRKLQRQYWNAFKHMSDKEGQPRDDTDMLGAFSDSANDAALFVGWHDYFTVTGKLPIAVQVFQLWWFALNEEKLAPGTDLDTIRELFPDLKAAPRAKQKSELRRLVEEHEGDLDVLADPRTENNPLCFPASVFANSAP